MGFLRPKMPAMPAPPPPPVREDADATAQDYQDMLRRRRGRAASILTGKGGAEPATTAAKQLLGQ